MLIPLIEAMADPRYGVEHSGNTPGAETLVIVNAIPQLAYVPSGGFPPCRVTREIVEPLDLVG